MGGDVMVRSEQRAKRAVLLSVLRTAARRLVDACDDDPLLREWAADVEMAAQQFEAVPMVKGKTA